MDPHDRPRVVSRGLHPPHSPVGFAVGFELARPGRVPIYLDTVVAFDPALTGPTPSETENNYVAQAERQLAGPIAAFYDDPAGADLTSVPVTAAPAPPPVATEPGQEAGGTLMHVEDDGERDPLRVPRLRTGGGLEVQRFLPRPWTCGRRRREFLHPAPAVPAVRPAGPQE